MIHRTAFRTMLWSMLLLQGFHLGEHTLQTVQRFAWHQDHAHGLLGARLDFEWMHFAANAMLWTGLVGILVLYAVRPEFWVGVRPIARRLFITGTVLQTYHVIEHTVRIVHLLTTGVEDPRGILGQVTDGVLLHLATNLAVYLSILPLLWTTLRDDVGIVVRTRAREILALRGPVQN